jgi:hypothetical protein
MGLGVAYEERLALSLAKIEQHFVKCVAVPVQDISNIL